MLYNRLFRRFNFLGLNPQLLVETVFIVKSFSVEIKHVSSIIHNYLKAIGKEDVINKYELEPFEIKVQTLERTLIDKVFAICDYMLDNKTKRNSRHIYDLSQLLTRVVLDNNIKNLIKVPHFKFSGSLNPLEWKNNAPKVNVEWYAKGGVMTKPTLFGVNPATGNPMVGGEAGAEAIAPIDTLQQYVSSAVKAETGELAHTMNRMYDLLVAYLPSIRDNMDRPLVFDTGAMVNNTVDKMDNALGNKASRKSRFGV